MDQHFKIMREDVTRLQTELEGAKRRLEIAVRHCAHTWGTVLPDHIHHEGYLIPGDPPGVGGSDHRCACYVDAKIEKRWKRVCSQCGEVQYTSNTRQIVSEEPKF